MPDAHDVNDEYVVDDLVDDSVVTHANAIHTVLTCHRDACRWAWILSEKLDGGANSLLIAALECGQ